MRMIFLPRRRLAAISMLAVLVSLVGALRVLGSSEQVAAWVSAGLNGEAPIITGGQAADGISLLVAVEGESTPNEVGAMLSVLAENNARGTFFISGEFAAANTDTLLSVKAAGHELGVLGKAGGEQAAAQAEMAEVAEAIEQATGDVPLLYMPSGGLAEGGARNAAKECSLMFVLGSVDSGDWQSESAEQIIAQVLERAEAGSFITISPCERSCVALSVLLPELAAKGLHCRTVSENLVENSADYGE